MAGPAAKLKTRSEVGGATAVGEEYEHVIEMGFLVVVVVVARVIGRLVVIEGLKMLGFLRRKV